MIRLVLADMDGTLKPVGMDAVSDRTVRAVAALREAGMEFGPASGRPRHDVVEFFRGDASCSRTGIVAGGKLVYVGGRPAFRRPMAHDALQALLEVVRTLPLCYLTLFSESPEDLLAPTEWLQLPMSDGTLREMRGAYPSLLGDRALDALPTGEFYVAGLTCDSSAEAMGAVREAVASAVPEVELVSPIPGWFDVNPRGWGKANGFGVLLDLLGMAAEEVVFLGDSENDLSLMALAPNSVCVANGTPEAIDAAAHLIPSAEDDGPALLMEALVATGGQLQAALDLIGAA